MKTLKQDIKNYIIDRLNDGIGAGHYGCDLHNELLNMDYFIIGTYEAKQWLGAEAFDAIGAIQEYEQVNFGEVTTDLSSPEKVANMLAYIIGEEILDESEFLRDAWDELLNESDLADIAKELAD